jgi:hypothetical protein
MRGTTPNKNNSPPRGWSFRSSLTYAISLFRVQPVSSQDVAHSLEDAENAIARANENIGKSNKLIQEIDEELKKYSSCSKKS